MAPAGESKEMLAVAAHAAGGLLAAGSHDGFVRLWDPRAGGSAAPRETYYELHSEPVAKVPTQHLRLPQGPPSSLYPVGQPQVRYQ